jgi:AraC-like DNA-binding protein
VNPAGSREIAVNDDLKPWFRDAQIRLIADQADGSSAFMGNIYNGERLKVIRLRTVNIKRVLFRNNEHVISIVIAESGRIQGRAAGQAFRTVPNRFAFMLLENEIVDLRLESSETSGLGIQISKDAFEEECSIHGCSKQAIRSLRETVPGHEELLNACARQLLEYSEQRSTRLTWPLESSILSLLAGLVIESEEKGAKQKLENQSPQQAYVEVAIKYFELNMASAITLTDVCRACSVSARTLQVAFNAVMGRSPLLVLHELRLARLRQILLSGVAVNTACRQVGLLPSGRVSGSYKKMFGELPRDTLRKTSDENRDTGRSLEI